MAAGWAAFLASWVVVAFLALGAVGLGPCGGDGGSPYAAPASAAGRYCRAWDAYFDSGEPGEVTTALVWFWPVVALAGLGAVGVWRQKPRLLAVSAALAFLVPVAHVALAFSLNNRCSPDDDSAPQCQHY